jgi:zinc transport system permease protein
MTDMLQYDFMRRAFLIGIVLAVVIPCIGVIVVLKRLSMIGDALSHTSLAGVAAGLILGLDPVIGAAATSVAAALGIEAIRRRFPRHAELSIAIVMSAGVGLAGVLSGFVQSAAGFNSFLFGSIVAISDQELAVALGGSLLVLVVFLILYRALFFIALDEEAARLAGVPVTAVNLIFTILTALTVATAARTVGALIVSSLLVIPVACAMQFGRSYKQTVIYAIGFALVFVVTGLTLAWYLDLRPGGATVLTGVVCLVLILIGNRRGRRPRRPAPHER